MVSNKKMQVMDTVRMRRYGRRIGDYEGKPRKGESNRTGYIKCGSGSS
jgi:hypothetical protein